MYVFNYFYKSEKLGRMNTKRGGCAAVIDKERRIYAIGGWDGSSYLNSVECYNPETNKWSEVTAMNTKRGGCAAVIDKEGRIYAIGGCDGLLSDLNSVECYNPETKKWSEVTAMNTKRWGCAAVIDKEGRIYAIGGYDGSSGLNSVECYNPETNKWSEVTAMNTKRGGCAAVIDKEGWIYAIGGFDGLSYLNSVECYNPETKKWSEVTAMNTKRRACAAVIDKEGRIYAIGGWDGSLSYLNSVECYNPETKKWSEVTAMNTKRYACAAVIDKEGRIYAIGGWDGSSYLNSVERYDSDSNKWCTNYEKVMKKLPTSEQDNTKDSHTTSSTPGQVKDATSALKDTIQMAESFKEENIKVSNRDTQSNRSGLHLLEDVQDIIKHLKDGKNKEAKDKLLKCQRQEYPSPNIFKLIPGDDILDLLRSPDQIFYEELKQSAQTLIEKVDENVNKPDTVVFGNTQNADGPLALKNPTVMDHTVREPATNTPYGHTAYMKYLSWQLVRKGLSCKNIALSGMYYGDMYTVEEQFLQLLYEKEGEEAMRGGFVMCDPGEFNRKQAMRMIKEYKVPNIFLDVSTTSKSIAEVGNDIIAAVDEANTILPNMEKGNSEPMGQVYINFIDLMECVELNLVGGINPLSEHEPEHYMSNKENLEALEQLFQQIKDKTRIRGILYEEARGRGLHSDYAVIAAWLRKHFLSDRYLLLLHAHGGAGTEHAASLDSVKAGADGVWAGFIPQAARAGHNSYFLYLDNLMLNGNMNVWDSFDLHVGVEIAKMLYSLNFNTVQFPDDCPIWGRNTQPLVHTAFDITKEGDWRRRTNGIYHCWSDEDKALLNKMRQDLAILENNITRKQTFENYHEYRIAPLVTDAANIGRRMGELKLVKKGNRTANEARQMVGERAREIMIATMNAGIRVNFNERSMLEKVAKWIKCCD